MITAWHDPGFFADIGTHIMPIRKFDLVAQSIRANIQSPTPISREMLEMVHNSDYVDAILSGTPGSLAESQKFPWTPQLWPSVLLTNGAVLAAARTALQDGVGAALASGFHHACHDHGEGFCTFNGLVIAAEVLYRESAVRRVAVLDMDLHYANGTASLLARRPWLRQLSIYGNDYWNNVSYRDVSIRQHQDGDNHFSKSIPALADWPILKNIMEKAIPEFLDHEPPDLLLYQAGADYLQDDPYSPLRLDHAALLERDRMVFQIAKDRKIPIAWTLAGGYSEDIQKIVKVHTNTFLAAQEIYD